MKQLLTLCPNDEYRYDLDTVPDVLVMQLGLRGQHETTVNWEIWEISRSEL